MAVLDSGVDYAHPEFLNPDGTTRIAYLWDQTITGTPPLGFNIGAEFTATDINKALSFNTPAQQLMIVPSQDTLGHGTAVTSIAAGNTLGAAPGATLIIVKIGRKNDLGFARTTELMRGIAYVSRLAKVMNMPISINISFGTNDGSHDGFSLFERYIDDMSYSGKTNIIIATGNEGDTGKHFSYTLTQGATVDMEFSIVDRLKRLTINLWKNFVDTFTFEITSPQGVSSGELRFSNQTRRFTFNSCSLYVGFGAPNFINTAQSVYFFFDAPLAISTGVWTITIHGASVVSGKFDAWLPITEISGKTYFLVPTADTSLTIPSTAFAPIGVGGYNALIGTMSSFSGRGFTRVFQSVKPDLVAPDNSIYTAAPHNGYMASTGTSFAAPQVTGAVALLMQWGIIQGNDPFLYGQKVKAYLRLGAKRLPNVTYPSTQWGYGTLCLSQSKNYLLQMEVGNFNASEPAVLAMATLPAVIPSSEKMTIAQQITSPDYVDVVVRMNNEVEDFVRNNADVYVQILMTEFGILSMPASLQAIFNENQGKKIIQERPKNLGLMGRVDLESAGIINVQNQPYLNLRGNGTLVAVLDTGIDYTNAAFVYEDNTTKIDYIWDQTIQSNNPPEGFLYGTEYSQADINQALSAEIPREIVPHEDNNGHGTFLAGIAAAREEGSSSYIGAAPDANLIVVKLKQTKEALKVYSAIDPNTEEVYSSSDLMLAIEYVRQKAVELGKPIAICIGMGTNEGGHDGLSLFETYVSAVASKNALVMVSAMGNEGRTRRHVRATIPSPLGYKDLEIRVGEREYGFTVYVFATTPDKLSISLTSPTGEFINPVPNRTGQIYETMLLLEKSIIRVKYVFASPESSTEYIAIRIIHPTPGLWMIRVKADLLINGVFHSWLPISNFLDTDTYFLESISDYTLTMPATAENVLAIGAYNASSDILYVSTSRGPNRLNMQNPSVVAPGVDVATNRGIISGTSAAAAITAGGCALMLEWAIVQGNESIFNTLRAISYLTAGADRREGITYPSTQWGYGILNLMGAFGSMRIL